jgi:AcrR family transcriptional regulator
MAMLLCEQDLRSVTVGQIACRAGVSRSRFYELFGSLEDCSFATFALALELAGKRIIAAYEADAGSTWANRVRAALKTTLEFFDEEPELARVAVGHALGAPPEALARRSVVLDQLAQVLDEEGRRASPTRVELPPELAQTIVRGVLSVIHERLRQADGRPLTELLNSLMFVIVLPYQRMGAARRQLLPPVSEGSHPPATPQAMRALPTDLQMRLGHRTEMVLAAIEASPGISNRAVADAAEVKDEGQISRLLARAQGKGLISNTRPGRLTGQPNAWMLTARGQQVARAAALHNGRTGH